MARPRSAPASRTRVLALVAGIVLLAGALPACSVLCFNVFAVLGISEVPPTGGKSFAPGTGAHYVSVKGNRKGDRSSFFSQIDRDLWPPFRWECSAGRFDPASEGNGAACLEINVRGTSPPAFFAVCVEPIDEGLHVFATSDAGQALGQRVFAGANVADLALEHDGQTLHFLARPAGTTDFTTIATASLGAPQKAFIPALQVIRLSRGEVLGFNRLRIATNGAPPAPVSEQKAAAESVHDGAITPLVEAAYALDGPVPDPDTANARLAEAESGIDAAVAAVAALPRSGASRKAKRDLAGARKQFLSLEKAVATGARQTAVAKRLGNALTKLFTAVQHLDPLTHD